VDTLWKFRTWLDAFDHWQTLLAGILGFTAAIVAVVIALRSERRKAARDLEALRRSIGLEVRQCTAVALGSFQLLAKLAQKKDGPITYRMVQSYAHFQDALIFPAVADKIGLLGSDAIEVLIFYNSIDAVRRGISQLANYRTPDDISPNVVAGTTNCLTPALRQGSAVIAALKIDDARTQERDEKLRAEIDAETTAWDTLFAANWPALPK
jgi:hypothetical protein